jgi:L,D-transpeptidase YcbB
MEPALRDLRTLERQARLMSVEVTVVSPPQVRSTTFGCRVGGLLLLLGALSACHGALAAQATPSPQEIQLVLARLREQDSASVGGEVVKRSEVLLGLYQQQAFRPLWTATRADQLAAAVRDARLHGLTPADYHLARLTTGGPVSSPSLAEIDVLRTDALVRLAHDLRFGKLEPSGPGSGADLSRPLRGGNAVGDLSSILSSSNSLEEELRALRPDHFVYRGLVQALVRLHEIEDAGGWEQISGGPTMRLDSADARVPKLRTRLALEGDLPSSANPSLVFDAKLESAVRSFQHRHGLNEDGVVGAGTLTQLNVPVRDRIDQVRINLERARWVTAGLPDTFVIVNIAGAKVYLVQAGSVVLEQRVVVGTRYTRTPIFRATMTHVELSPTWTVPTSIVDEVLPLAARDPLYMSKQGMRLVDGKGDTIPSQGIDFARFKPADFPWTFRQDPGPANPLGGIKFVFPNAHNVYLHDTPSRQLFERQDRLFSHGCIRVQDPLALAELLLGDPVNWSRAGLEAAIAEGETRIVPLPKPMEVVIQYWTASVDEVGVLHFYRDVYGRDAALLRALGRE